MCVQPGEERETSTRGGMGQIWNVMEKLAALRTLLSGQVIFCITGVRGRGYGGGRGGF